MLSIDFMEALKSIDWMTWIIFAVMLVTGIIMAIGKGEKLIGQNVAKGKEKYDPKKFSVVTGVCLIVMSLLVLFFGFAEGRLEPIYTFIALGACVVIFIIMVILGNTVCKKK